MFTGIVEGTGKIKSILEKEDGKRITVETDLDFNDLKNGDSVAVNGVCLTVETNDPHTFTIFAVPETLGLTNVGLLQEGSEVNLERAMSVHDRLGGHIVQGHVEDKATVYSVEKFENHWDITIQYKSPFMIPKGSVAIDGISLTIHELQGDLVRFQIIPETIKKTNIPVWKKGYVVNIETDYLVKAIDHIVRWREENK